MKLTPAQRTAVNGRATVNERQAYLSALNVSSLPMPLSFSSESSFDYPLEEQSTANDEFIDEEVESIDAWINKVDEEEREQGEGQEEEQEEQEEEEDDDTDRILAWIHMVED